MKKIIFVLAAALVLGMGSMSAQNKFKAAKSKTGTTKTEKVTPKTETKTDTKAAAKVEAKGNAFAKPKATSNKIEGKAEKKADATKTATKVESKAIAKPAIKTAVKPATKVAKPAAKKASAGKPVELSMFNGVWANSYSDGIGGMVTDYLNLTFDESTGTATGEYKDENGDGRKVSGKLVGNTLLMKYDADGDEFATIRIINENTLKLEGFTGTFKRVENMDAAPKVDIPIPVTSAPVDPAYEEVKKYLEDN